MGQERATASQAGLRDLKLLTTLEPRWRAFFGNLAEAFRPRRRPRGAAVSGPFGRTVFVSTALPWAALRQSALYHLFVITAIWGLSVTYLGRPRPHPRFPFENAQVIYYQASEYLPPLDTGSSQPWEARKGQPEHARQPIISLPQVPDNPTQTIVAPPALQLQHDVPLPNLVGWTAVPAPVPVSSSARSAAQLQLPALLVAVIAPPPQTMRDTTRNLDLPQTSVIAPPPETTPDRTRALNLPPTSVVAPPPEASREVTHVPALALPQPGIIAPPPETTGVASQVRSSAPGPVVVGPAPEVAAVPPTFQGLSPAQLGTVPAVAPPPSLVGMGSGPAAGQLIALSLHPAEISGPIAMPEGNRRGIFAATPQGTPGARGTPDVEPGTGRGRDAGNGTRGNGPPGIFVGAGPNQATPSAVAGTPTAAAAAAAPNSTMRQILMTAVRPAPLSQLKRPTETAPVVEPAQMVDNPGTAEAARKIFGAKKYYSMVLNMPNLTSVGGSWVMRFAELRDSGVQGDLVAPVAMEKVDPAYPASLMRTRVEGTVTLYAVIRSDGRVGDVRVLSGVDERLGEYARVALLHWRFRPATKNGNAVPLEAVVLIPFLAHKSSF